LPWVFDYREIPIRESGKIITKTAYDIPQKEPRNYSISAGIPELYEHQYRVKYPFLLTCEMPSSVKIDLSHAMSCKEINKSQRKIQEADTLHYVLEILNELSRKCPPFVTSEAWTRDNGMNGETCIYGKAIEGFIVGFCCLSYGDIVSNAANKGD
jgi:hypothetical protein